MRPALKADPVVLVNISTDCIPTSVGNIFSLTTVFDDWHTTGSLVQDELRTELAHILAEY